MTSSITTGARLRSQVCGTEVIVVRGPAAPLQLDCGGAPLVALTGPDAGSGPGAGPAAGLSGGTLLGKRYTNPDGSLELLVTKPGEGTLTADGVPLEQKAARPLPSSD